MVGGVEMLPLGVLIFVVGALAVSNIWALIDAKLIVSSAAREAVRTLVEAEDLESGVAAGEAAARRVMAGGGRHPDRFALAWTGRADGTASLARCARVGAKATYRMPALAVPWLGGMGEVLVSGTASELVDPYRDGLAGVACGQ